MHPMGVITCTVPMNPYGDVIYTHKKFKRATSEACDNAEQQQQNERGKKGGTEVAPAGARTPSATPQASPAGARPTIAAPQLTPTLVNGHVTAHTIASVTGSVGSQLSVEHDDNKRKVSNSSGGKYKCEYCGVGCAKPSVLDKHKRTHTNERPYSCEQCSLAFKTKSNYKKHTKSRTHVRKCDGVAHDNSDGTIESSDNIDGDVEDGPKSANKDGRAQQLQPADLSLSRTSIRDQPLDLPSASVSTHPDELGTPDRGKSLYKPKFHISAHYAHRDERGPKGQTPPPSRQQPTPPQDAPQLDHTAINPSTYQPHTASTHGQPNQGAPSNPSRHSPSPATVSKQGLPPLDIWAANKKDEVGLSGQRNSVATPQSANSLWKGIKSPSPELVGQHITKLIVENQAIVDTHNPLWSRRYRRQPSIGSSSSESDGSGTSKSRRSSLADLTIKNSKAPAVGPSSTAPSPAGLGPGPLQQQYSRERNHSITAEAMMAESRSSYSPSLPPTPHLPLAQPPVTPISASKPSISSQGHTTSYSQSAPAFTTSTMGMMDLTMVEGSRKRRSSEGPSVVRDIHKSRVTHVDDPAILRQHPQNPEGSVIKSLLLHSRAAIAGTIDQNLERLECERLNQPTDGHYQCSRCGIPCRSPENLEVHLRHYCGQRHGGTGSERGTPDSVKSGDGGRWPSEQDVALDLQKKPDRTDHFERERSLSRGSSVGESSQRRGSEEENRYRSELSPRIYRSESVPEGASPPTKKRKMSDIDSSSQDRSLFLPPIFSPRGQGACKGDTGMKILEDMNKQKSSNLQLFGGEVQICDGNERKTMRIDPSQPPSPAIDICIPPQQLGGNIPKAEVSLPTSVVVTIAKSGLNSGGTMVQVESQISTSSTKTVPSLVSSSISREQPSVPTQTQSNSKAPHSTIVYNNDASKFAFSPFLPYAPLLQIPNLAIPGIPTPDLGSLSFPAYPASGPVQPFLPVKNSPAHGMVGKHKVSNIHSPAAPSPSKLSPGAGMATSGHPGAGMATSGHLPSGNPLGNQQVQVIREKEKEQYKVSSKSPATYPALIPIGDEKVPYVPGIPGPYSQAGMVVQPPMHRIQKNPAVFAPPISSSSFIPVSQAPGTLPQPPALMSPSREKGLQPPRSKDFPRSPVREHSQSFHVTKIPSRQSPQLPPKELQISRGKAVNVSFKASERNMTPDVRIHPVVSEANAFDKKAVEKSPMALDEPRNDTAGRDETKECEEFLPPRKRPNSLALKPQPYVPNSSLALIGTTLVSPDTPRPKKSCVQMFLNGSAYTYLGHKVSTKSYFCCISRQQPMYVPQSTDPKLSMYSNWQLRKPAEDNPLNLTPYQHMSLYTSRKVDQTFTVAKPRELNLIQTHSSYWTFKEEKEKNKAKEDKHKERDPKVVKNEDPVTRTIDPSTSEDSRPAIKREPEEDCAEPSSKSSDDAEISDSSSVKRIKIFEGGFKSSEDYTYVRGRGRGRYVCGVCEIRCKKPSMLKKHIRTHTDLRPYACSHCTFSFKTKGNLTKHLRSKAHYKRCMEMGIVPVPTVVDESHVNEEALAIQGKMEQEQERVLDGGDDDDDDDDEEDEDEEDDGDEDEEEDDEALENDQFEDADKMDLEESCSKSEAELKRELRESKENMGLVGNPSRGGVLVMAVTSYSSSASPAFAHNSKDTKSQKPTENAESLRDSPMDLSVRKTAVLNLSPAQDKNTSMKKPPVPRRPSFLPLMAKSSVTDRSPVANLTSPGTPTTPIREHPSEILSPVTESSSLLKSIYNTTSRATHVSNREKLDIVIDPSKENGCNNSMLQAYIKECAVLDTTIKRQQYKDSSSDTSPDSPRNSLLPNHSATSVSTAGAENSNDQSQKSESIQNDRGTSLDEIKREGRTENETQGVNSEPSCASDPSPSSCATAINSTPQAATSRMPTPPANLTVMNNGGMDTKTAFLVPSGVVPSSLNRLGNDDGKCRCSICHKEFNRPSQLTLHMNIHYMERPYRCDSCAISFRTNGHLQKHKRSVSHFNKVNRNMTFGTPSTDNPRPFKCHDCKIAFRIHGHLAKHLRSKMHIMKLECLGKLPFGTYAEIERSGANLNEIDTTDCENSLESLQVMASRLYEKDPSKLAAWQNQQQHRVRTVSNSSTNSDDYPLQDDQDDSLVGCGNDEDTEGDEDEELTVPQDAPRLGVPGSSVGPVPAELHSPHSHGIPPIEIGSGATAGLLACHICHEKFLDLEHLSGHLYNVHKVSVTYRNS